MKMSKKNLVKALGAGLFAASALFVPMGQAAASDMDDFKAAYMQTPVTVEHIITNIVLFSPSFHADTTLNGNWDNGGFGWLGGKINWSNTNLNTELTQKEEIPIYMEKNGNNVTFFGKSGNKWLRENLTGLPIWILELIKTRDNITLAQNAEAVKSVEENDLGAKTQFNVTLSGSKLAEFARAKDPYLAEAVAKNDVVCTWVVNKKDKRTLTLSVDLTKVMQNYAQSLLEASYQSKISLTQKQKDLYQTLGYYCNLQVYCSVQDRYDQAAYNAAMADAATAKAVATSGSILGDLQNRAVKTTLKQ